MTQHHEIEISPPSDDTELRAFTGIVSRALFFPDADLDVWVRREGVENVRVARRLGKVVGGLVLQRMGQWFGQRSVPMTGIRGVGVAPEHRASGVGSRLMRAVLAEMHRSGVALSTLFPATQPIYRRPGFEQAGVRLRYQLSTRGIDARDRTLDVRPIEKADHPSLVELYTERARRTAGNLDRNAWAWQRILDPPPWAKPGYGYLAARAGQPEGYIVFSQKPGEHPHNNELEVADFVVLTADAGRRLLTLLADHRSMAEWVSWNGAPADPISYLLAEQHLTIKDRIDWMLRIVDIRAALEARGYPAGLNTELHLKVADDLLARNNQRYVLEIADSKAEVHEGGRGELGIDIRGLASLYTGHLSPAELRATGYLEASDEVLATAAATFAGPAPWMSDIF